MMDDMIVSNVMQEKSSLPSQEIPINSRSSPPLECPSSVTVVWNRRIGVLQVRDRDEPMGDEEPRDAVELENLKCTPSVASQLNAKTCGQQADIGENYDFAVFRVEYDRVCC
jgi:hypothetical protein